MQLRTHLSFNGECEAAFRLYASCLDGQITFLLTYGESPLAAAEPEIKDSIVHATLVFNGGTLSGGDVPANRYKKPQGFALQLNIDAPDRAERIFYTLAEGGVILLPLQRTFWADQYGMLVDRFGTPWEINCSTGRTETRTENRIETEQ